MYLRKYSVPLKMLAYGTALAGATAWALSEYAHASGWDVEAHGGRSWSGNISAGGETDPTLTKTLERVGEYALGFGGGWNSDSGWRIGGRLRYWSAGCDESAAEGCSTAFPGEEVETRALGMLGVVEYTFQTPLIVDPFLGLEMGLGTFAFDCEGRDACPVINRSGEFTGGNANHMDYGFLYGFCGGLRLPLTDNRRYTLTAAACHHRTEGVNADGIPHWDAPSETTAELRLGRQF